jgi:beta-fructofuranosidase
MNIWKHRGPTIPMPGRIDAGYRDPVRAFDWQGKWWVGVGCGSKEEGAQFCLFEADDETLANFTDRGSLYTTNITFGEMDDNIVWRPNNVSADMMECPDLFPLGDKWILIGSLYKTNQFWVGLLSGDPPRFTPERVGILDYGNGYAAKTGSTLVQSGTTRRPLFGFSGWAEPTAVPGCGRSLIMPRELSVRGNQLVIQPVAETKILRVPHSRMQAAAHPGETAELATGSQVELRVQCTGLRKATGKVAVRTLATSDGSAYTEIGYDLDGQAMYADHSKCCRIANTIVQRAPLLMADLEDDGDTVTLTVFVDGGLVEAFAADLRVITPLVAPDPQAARPADRRSTLLNNAQGVTCTADSWQLRY